MVGRDLSPPPVEMGNSEILASVVPTDISDETSASFHSTPDFHHAPQTPSSHIYLEVPTPLTLHTKDTAGPHFYNILAAYEMGKLTRKRSSNGIFGKLGHGKEVRYIFAANFKNSSTFIPSSMFSGT